MAARLEMHFGFGPIVGSKAVQLKRTDNLDILLRIEEAAWHGRVKQCREPVVPFALRFMPGRCARD